MISIDRQSVAAALPYALLIDALAEAFRSEITAPLRHRHDLQSGDAMPSTLLLMPSWGLKGRFGIKLVTVQPENERHGRPTVQSVYLLGDVGTGEFSAMLDAEELTLRRTAAASALASRYLSRADSRTLLMIGTGHLAPHLVRAHCAVRPIERVLIWGRTPAKVAACSAALAEDLPIDVRPVTSIEEGMRSADVISCATLSEQPLVRGAHLRSGQHVDLVGSYLPTMRESDDAAILRASVFVDSRAGALSEAGDLVQPLRDRVIDAGHVCADLTELVRGQCAGRRDEAEITLFKSVGLGLEDLAAASLVLDRRGEAPRA